MEFNMIFKYNYIIFTIYFLLCFYTNIVLAQANDNYIKSEEEKLAQDLSNPVSSLVSVPIQFNYDRKAGTGNGELYTINVQPVIPFELNDQWNLISRTILPITKKRDISPSISNEFGLGDTIQSLFFSPKSPNSSGWIWGAGPVFLFPTGTSEVLSTEKFGAGPTAVALKQSGPLTYGLLSNHIWSCNLI